MRRARDGLRLKHAFGLSYLKTSEATGVAETQVALMTRSLIGVISPVSKAGVAGGPY